MALGKSSASATNVLSMYLFILHFTSKAPVSREEGRKDPAESTHCSHHLLHKEKPVCRGQGSCKSHGVKWEGSWAWTLSLTSCCLLEQRALRSQGAGTQGWGWRARFGRAEEFLSRPRQVRTWEMPLEGILG